LCFSIIYFLKMGGHKNASQRWQSPSRIAIKYIILFVLEIAMISMILSVTGKDTLSDETLDTIRTVANGTGTNITFIMATLVGLYITKWGSFQIAFAKFLLSLEGFIHMNGDHSKSIENQENEAVQKLYRALDNFSEDDEKNIDRRIQSISNCIANAQPRPVDGKEILSDTFLDMVETLTSIDPSIFEASPVQFEWLLNIIIFINIAILNPLLHNDAIGWWALFHYFYYAISYHGMLWLAEDLKDPYHLILDFGYARRRAKYLAKEARNRVRDAFNSYPLYSENSQPNRSIPLGYYFRVTNNKKC